MSDCRKKTSTTCSQVVARSVIFADRTIYFFALFVCLSAAAIVVLPFYLDTIHSAEDFSFIAGGTCSGVAGESIFDALDETAKGCVRAYIEDRADELKRNFMDAYTASLLFFVYSLHTTIQLIRLEKYRIGCKFAFECATLVEAVFLGQACLHLTGGGLINAEDEMNLLEYPGNSPYNEGLVTLTWNCLIFRGIEILVVFLLFIFDDKDNSVYRRIVKLWNRSPKDSNDDQSKDSKPSYKPPHMRSCCTLWWERTTKRLEYPLTKAIELVYFFCFVVVMGVSGALILWFHRSGGSSPPEEFSHLIRGNCGEVMGGAAHERCVHAMAYEMGWQDFNGYLTTHVAVYLFFALTINEGLDFFEAGSIWQQRAKAAFAMDVILGFTGTLATLVAVSGELYMGEFTLKHNSPMGGFFVEGMIVCTLAIRLFIVTLIFGFFVMDFNGSPSQVQKKKNYLEGLLDMMPSSTVELDIMMTDIATST